MTEKDLKGNNHFFFTYPIIYEISVGFKRVCLGFGENSKTIKS
jgi:hypothetical protein